MPIKYIQARQIYDSRGIPTLEVDLITDIGLFRAAVPSGETRGEYEAVQLRDDIPEEYLGKGVTKAIENVNMIIAPQLVKCEFEVTQQAEIDDLLLKMDGTENKCKLGANALLGVSIAVCKAGAAKRGIPLYRHIAELAGTKTIILPVPVFNIINGGINSGNKLYTQEFMILPSGARDFAHAMRMGSEVYHHLKEALKKKYGATGAAVVSGGGFAPNVKDNKNALKVIDTAITKAGYTGKFEFAVDVAATEFFKKGKYDVNFKKKKSDPKKWLTDAKFMATYKKLLKQAPLLASIEDPFEQDQWKSWTNITAGFNLQIVGDELTVSSPKRIAEAIEKKACNCILLKMNQIGTVTEAIKVHQLAKSNGWGTMISNSPGETEDTFLADFAVGLSTGQMKTGAPCRSELVAKYNHLLRIEEELGPDAKFAGRAFRKP